MSEAPGHLDFGGMGYLELSRELTRRGHQVSWLSFGSQLDRLAAMGCEVQDAREIASLGLAPWLADRDHGRLNAGLAGPRLDQLRSFESRVAEKRPDVLLIDRILVFAAQVAHEVGIPYAAVGTAGAHYYFDRGSVRRSPGPVGEYRALAAAIASEAGWREAQLDSFWVVSPFLNLCFLGKSFYEPWSEAPASHVRHFDVTTVRERRRRTGVSFGNQGKRELLLELTGCLSALNLLDGETDFFLGDSEDLYREIGKRTLGRGCRLHRWVDFAEYFPALRCLVFFGGLGTIWHCVNNSLPMLIVPGLVGDQEVNGEIVARLGLGVVLTDQLKPSVVNDAMSRLSDFGRFNRRFAAFRDWSNYTDSMEGACERLEGLI